MVGSDGPERRRRSTHRAPHPWLPALAAVAALSVGPEVAGAQAKGERAPVGEFRPPTPADRFRQDSTRNNLVHPDGYRPAPPNTLGRVERHGDGPAPLVLVAGLGFGGDVFDSLLPALIEEYTVYVVTLAGYGGSSAPPMPPEGTSYGERTWLAGAQRGLAALLAEEGLDRPIVASLYSDAANTVLHLARDQPERVGGVLVLSASARYPLPPNAPPRGEVLDGFADRWFRTVTELMWPSGMFTPDFYARSPEVAELAWWRVLEPSLPTSIRYTVETWADDLVPVVTEVSAPVIVLSPELEFLEGDAYARNVGRFHEGWETARARGATLEHRIVPGSRFLIWEDAPDAVTDALRELESLRRR